MKVLGVVVIAAVGGVTGAAPPVTMTLAANAPAVAYGSPVTLSGQISTKKANQLVTIRATECGTTNQVKAANVKTVADGKFSTAVKPALGTSYVATLKNGMSPVVPISVKPVAELKRVARGSFIANVTAGQALTGKYLSFQRYKRLTKRWAQVKRVKLAKAVSGPAKPTMISSVSFKSRLARGTRLRVLISKAQAAPCYVSAASKSIRA
jgi:hypothetical protein